MKVSHSEQIKLKAKELGFLDCGISKATFLENEAPILEYWLKNNMNAEMRYMENYFDQRLDPRLLVDNAKSVISVSFNYFTNILQQDPTAPKISKYAYNTDYHFVVKEKLNQLFDFINQNIQPINGRAFVDSAPVMDKAWAKYSGLGWIGKNSNLISKKSGSFFFLGELIIDLELDYDNSFDTNHCGKCTKCIDACPTQAISDNGFINGGKCISYLTIELKDEIPTDFKNKMDNWMFGCDICQDVCPWNRFSIANQEPKFAPNKQLMSVSKQEWIDLEEDLFKILFKNSPVKRTKFSGLKRNINFLDLNNK